MQTTSPAPIASGSSLAPWAHPHVRPARPADLPALVALLDRCSADTLYRRFHGATGSVTRRELARIANPIESHRSWVAVAGRAIHGTGTLAWGRDGVAEMAFLVEDAWMRRGLGRALADAMLEAAADAGESSVVAWVQADNERARRFVRGLAPGARTGFAGSGELEIVLPVISPRASAR